MMKKVGDEKFKRLRFLILKSVQYPSEQLLSESDQILFGHMDHWLPFSTSYAYAWQAGIFPILHQRGPHFEYEKYFTVEESQVRFIHSCVLKDCENGLVKSFYDYEDFFRAREKNPQSGIDSMRIKFVQIQYTNDKYKNNCLERYNAVVLPNNIVPLYM